MNPYPWLRTREGDGFDIELAGCTPAEQDRRLIIAQEITGGRVRIVDADADAWTFTADDFKEVEANFSCTRGEGCDVDEDVLEKLRAIVDHPMVAAATGGAEPWQRKLAVIEAKLREVQRDVEVKSMWHSVGIFDEILPELRALIES